ncbi:TetR/AcrR family transcriptional regulator [Janthinobacterium fluminis]|uniref:TetR/AcrR family transcriptional regulator n=1 Tax=Janthinobacterium fluminis TaxID=2987524 RepID=A0ABT5K3M6_9BURK|nr:TetR/AcrR family transcriptional regulator [Janthinobacterium fluminis]MDC8759013.1 TetR/AcrR family transcriptional regulator [Janthinobacterium fluminis]
MPHNIAMTMPLPATDQPDSAAQSAATDHSCCGKPAGRPRAADMEARMESLMGTAGCLFLQHGYSKVSLEAIAREAHVAVRTIYVKFGGKAGLFNAIITRHRERYFSTMANMDTDMRPIEQILGDFGLRISELISKPEAIRLHRMVLAEAGSNPELATTFYQVGPGLTRETLGRFFGRPDIAPLFRPGLPHEQLTVHLLNCIMGDQLSRLLFPPETAPTEAEMRAKVALGLDLFFRSALADPARLSQG